MDRIYQDVPTENIPWNIETPPDALVAFVHGGEIHPCKTINLGCGAGNYAIYLAGLGFDVTGVDSSRIPISIATENAKKRTSHAGLLLPISLETGMKCPTGLTLPLTGNFFITYSRKTGKNTFRMSINASTREIPIFPFVSATKTLSSAAWENSGKPG
jgi:hypothetical protein